VAKAYDIGLLLEGRRNIGLVKIAGALRRKGATQFEIENELLTANAQRCQPPLHDDEVRRVAASAMRWTPGGPDPLHRAWDLVKNEMHPSGYARFKSLAWHLQQARPGQSVPLPVQRIGELFSRDYKQVVRWRKRAMADGFLQEAVEYIKHQRAAEFLVSECPTIGCPTMQDANCPTIAVPPLSTNSVLPINNNGLVGQCLVGLTFGGSAHGGTPEWEQVERLALRGFRLFPCVPKLKKPLIKNWGREATFLRVKLWEWFLKYPRCNWAAACGRYAGYFVVDIDGIEAGTAFRTMCDSYGESIPDTLVTQTGRDHGLHFWFCYPSRVKITNKAGIAGWHHAIDLRSDGGFVMIPPSIWSDDPAKAHAENREVRASRPYVFRNGDDHPIQNAPSWLVRILTQEFRRPIYSFGWPPTEIAA
jgi:hypothetical protein